MTEARVRNERWEWWVSRGERKWMQAFAGDAIAGNALQTRVWGERRVLIGLTRNS